MDNTVADFGPSVLWGNKNIGNPPGKICADPDCDDKDMSYDLFFHKGVIAIKEWRSRGNSIRPVCTKLPIK